MNRVGIGIAALGLAFATTTGAGMAQERPSVSHSESARAAGPTCVVGGAATDCAGSAIGSGIGPVIISAPVVTAPMPVSVAPGGLIGPVSIGGVDSDVDVARSTRSGSTIER